MATPLATGRASLEVTGSLTRGMLAGARRVRPERGRLAKSVRIVVCVVAPLVVGLALGEVKVGLAVTFGAFAGFHGHAEPYPQRARLVAAMTSGYVAAVMAGTLGQHGPVVAVLVTGAFAASAGFVCQALALPAPREYMLVLICLLVGALPVPLAPPLALAGLTALGGLWAWIVLMSGWLTDRERPERETVRAALRAIIRLVGAAPETRPSRRHDAVLATRTARRSVEFAGGPTAPLLRSIQLEAEDLLDAALVAVPHGPQERPPLVPAGARSQVRSDRQVRMRHQLGRLIEATDAALPRPGFRRVPRDPSRPPLRSGLWSVRNAFGADSLVPPTALRFGIAVGGSLALGFAIGVPRPYWIALTTAAVLQGATLLTTARRALERAAGTAAGMVIGAAIVAAQPNPAGIIVGVAVFLFLTQMTIAASYVVAVTFITPMTLLLSETGAPGTLTDSLIGWRLADTLIGCTLGFAAGRLLWPSSARERLDHALERALTGVEALLDLGLAPADAVAAAAESPPVDASVTARWMLARDPDPEDPAHALARRATRHELRVRLLNLRSVTDAALGDRFTSAPREDELWPICAAAQQVGYRALAHGGEGDPEELRSELVRIRRELASR